MSAGDFKYGIFNQNGLMTEMSKAQSQRTAILGQIVKVEAVLGNEKLAVKFLKDGETWESTTFCCSRRKIYPLDEKLWPYIYAIPSPQERVKLAMNRDRCEKLCKITKDITVGFIDTGDIYLGTIKYLGTVKGMGKCVGIQLHTKKRENKCDGSCAGIQYFNCLPGYGVFTTIDRISLYSQNMETVTQRNDPASQGATTDLDLCLERNMSQLNNVKDDIIADSKPQYESIVTKYGEYPKNLNLPAKTNTYIRNSLSLQNIVDVKEQDVNSNNDFDQNSIIQPDKTYLVGEGKKLWNKSEMDLSEIIGKSWHGATDPKHLEEFSNLTKTLEKKENGYSKSTLNKARNKSPNPLSHLYDGTYIKKKNNNEVVAVEKKLNERSDSQLHQQQLQQQQQQQQSQQHQRQLSGGGTVQKIETPPKIRYLAPKPGATNDLTVGSLVEVSNEFSRDPLYGVVRWLGAERGSDKVVVGVELEEEQSHLKLPLTDGSFEGERWFECAENRALFIPLTRCRKDPRFTDAPPVRVSREIERFSDEVECPVIRGAVAPLCMPTEEDVEAVCGKLRGIQGHHNSCYLDVTLFSMFTYTAVFDTLLFRPKGPQDIADYEEVQRVLREEIVNPLRKNLFVSADHVMNLRKLLDRLSSVSGLTSEEKDPEEFLNSLLAQILKAEPFLKLSSGQEAYYYQLFMEKDADLTLPTVQQLFEQSFLTSNIKLKEVPSCLIIQMPRFGKNYKMYPRILPSQLLDVTDVIEGSPRQCMVCGKLAGWECRECFDVCGGAGLESTSFCDDCLRTAHRHEKRSHHRPTALAVPHDFSIMAEHCRPPRLYMELFAVICIETSHYVAFVKCGVGHEAPWCFFDSMADRRGEKNGYNIPEMVACPDVSRWLSDEGICRKLHEDFPLDRHLPEHARRLLCDAYICMYQSPDVMMYR